VVATLVGEAPTLSPTEHRVLIHIAVDVARGRVPVIAGASSNSTAQAIELTRDAERLGAAAVISVVPYYNKPGQAGILAHFDAIRRSTSLPIILNDAPSRCASALSDAMIAQLSANGQFIGLVDASGDVTRPTRLRPVVGPTFLLLSGDDRTAFAFQALGGNGCVSAVAGLVPTICRDLSRALGQGDMQLAERLSSEIKTIAGTLADAGDPVPVKFALSLTGLMAPTVRLPLVELSPSRKSEIAGTLNQIRANDPDMRMPWRRAGIANSDYVAARAGSLR
jgi:4-hydroxy-tetrahydrodipicolinate synthase